MRPPTRHRPPVPGGELRRRVTADGARQPVLLQEERTELDVSFTVPVMPSGLDENVLDLPASANHHGVRVRTVNLMTMNYGESYDGDTGDYAVTSAEAANVQFMEVFGLSGSAAWRGKALTSMIGVNDVGGETFTLADAAQVHAFAEEKGIARVSMWSSFRDRPCAEGSGAEDAATDCSGGGAGGGCLREGLRGLTGTGSVCARSDGTGPADTGPST